MDAGRTSLAGLAGATNDVAALDLIAALDRELLGVPVGRDVVVGVAHEREIAERLESAAGVDHHAILGRPDRRVFRDRDCDAAVVQSVALRTEARDDWSVHGPVKDGGRLRVPRRNWSPRGCLVRRRRRRSPRGRHWALALGLGLFPGSSALLAADAAGCTASCGGIQTGTSPSAETRTAALSRPVIAGGRTSVRRSALGRFSDQGSHSVSRR
jgi:hypothetical protein